MKPRKPKRVLVVDDDTSLREMLALELSDAGYQVVSAGSYLQALLLASRQDIDCALLDYQLPDGNGQDLLRAIALLHPQVPIVMMSAARTPQRTTDALRAGADAFLDKPVTLDTLLAKFQSAA